MAKKLVRKQARREKLVIILLGANGSVATDTSKKVNRMAEIPKAMSELIVKGSDQEMFPPLSRPNSRKKTVKTSIIAPPISIRLMLAGKSDLLVAGRWRVSATEAIANRQIGTCIKNALVSVNWLKMRKVTKFTTANLYCPPESRLVVRRLQIR